MIGESSVSTVANPFASYKPAERQAAAQETLAEAVKELNEAHVVLLAYEMGDDVDPDELRILRERVEGCKGRVKGMQRYIRQGCLRMG
jgi:hypothetical protein